MSEDTPTLPVLTRGALLDALGKASFRFEDVPVPAWGGALRVREVGADRRFEIEDAITGEGEFKDATLGAKIAHLLRLCAIDEAGAAMLSDEDRETIAKQPPSVIYPIFRAVCRVNRLEPEAAAEHVGKSEAGPLSASRSG